jgi:ribosomal protein L7/L12
MTLLIAASALIIVTVILSLISSKRVDRLRSHGIYPQPGAASDEDVLRLLRLGHKIDAIKCYREVHGVGLKEAKEAVEKMEIPS